MAIEVMYSIQRVILQISMHTANRRLLFYRCLVLADVMVSNDNYAIHDSQNNNSLANRRTFSDLWKWIWPTLENILWFSRLLQLTLTISTLYGHGTRVWIIRCMTIMSLAVLHYLFWKRCWKTLFHMKLLHSHNQMKFIWQFNSRVSLHLDQ